MSPLSEDVEVTLRATDGTTARLVGDVAVVDRAQTGEYTPGLRAGNPRRVERFGVEDRTLRCTCPQYQETYSCPHVDAACRAVEARLNNALDRRVEPLRDYHGLGRQAWIGVRYDSAGL